jgi:hypothetical protein
MTKPETEPDGTPPSEWPTPLDDQLREALDRHQARYGDCDRSYPTRPGR